MIGQNIINLLKINQEKVKKKEKNKSFILNKSKIKKLRILCIGDIMLDHYVYGSVYRQSPEAPIPILNYENENFQLGGVGNVVRNISNINAKCTLLSIIGFDKASLKISELASKEKNISLETIKIKNFKTPIKTRFIKNFVHLLRVDQENSNFKLTKNLKLRIKNIFSKNIKKSDLVIVSDYDKGLLDKSLIKEIVNISKKHNKLIICDPKKNDFNIYKNIDILTPNQKEISDSAGYKLLSEKQIISYARKIMKKYNIKEILVTRSSKGMLLIGRDYTKKINANAKKVRDVTGAGDTVISVLGLMKAIGMSTADASVLANFAAGIIIGKPGTASLTYKELQKFF